MPRVLDDITEWSKLIVSLGTVHSIIYSDKVNVMVWENDFRIHTYLQIVTSQTRHILDDNPLDFSAFNIGNHPLEVRSVEIRSRKSIINIIQII